MQKVGKREKGEEGSAWPLCSGLPLSAAGAAQVEVREGFTQGLHGDSAVRARPRAPTTHSPLPSSPSSLEKSSVRPLSAAGAAPGRGRRRAGRGQRRIHTGIARRFCRARRAHARQPRTTFFPLLPSPYLTDAHCIVSTHYLLPSPPSSLLILDYSTLLYVVRTVPWFFAVAIPFFRGCGGLPSSFCPSRIF